jgi:hypothetical protein
MKTTLCRMAGACMIIILALTMISGCGSSSIKGTYSDPSGAWVLDLKDGGQATLTFYGDSRPCTYTLSGDQVAVTCKGERDKLNFTVHQDGSLSGQGFMPVLRKSK